MELRALNITDTYWLYAVNFNRSHTKSRSCTFFNVSHLHKTGMNYSSHYMENGTCSINTGRWKTEYIGKFYKSPVENQSECGSEIYNSFQASETAEKWHPRNYTLVFSDYENCSVLRLPGIGGEIWCMALLTPPAACTGMPMNCSKAFYDACNDTGIYEEVFDTGCTRLEI
ncbi:hypothetical protein V5799_014446 [Amblyomma americanum]|uniref:Lipocalin n=1 Tax=Amblyomma americanum TaxID=6943 RepID=A0AAQ4E305_AMBAM